jgi:hypothetical protein
MAADERGIDGRIGPMLTDLALARGLDADREGRSATRRSMQAPTELATASADASASAHTARFDACSRGAGC